MIDANVDDAVGDFLASRGHIVDFVNRSLMPATPDQVINDIARIEGWIIVSYDQQFLKRIQQPRFGFPTPVRSGYGRIMLMVRLSQQLARMRQCLDIVENLHATAVASERRLLLTIGPNWVRYDDEPLARTTRTR
jgi:hypothetical protein